MLKRETHPDSKGGREGRDQIESKDEQLGEKKGRKGIMDFKSSRGQV